ncbi:MAG TPA: type II secretion system F family protein [Bryobacteraceae bacterium]|nr:type II secretion system F family protein [Bryobacteraceae bacterium]
MLELLTAVVFLLVAGVTYLVAFRASNWRAKALVRLSANEAPAFLPAPGLVWQQLVNWIGSIVPASPKDLPLLKRRLVRAGFRDPNSARIFHGVRAVSGAMFCLAGVFVATRIDSGNTVLIGGAGAFLGYLLPMRYLMIRIARRKHAIERGLPNALDLMVVCVESGLGLDQTTLQVAQDLRAAYPEICEEFAVMNLEMRAGKRRAEALRNLADRTGVEDLKKLVAVLIQTDRFGTSIAATLRGHADYMRTMARQRAEEAAAKLAVKLVFPIFFCVLPSLFVVTVGPVLIRLVRDLFPMFENM